jgi:hypothetical protein
MMDASGYPIYVHTILNSVVSSKFSLLACILVVVASLNIISRKRRAAVISPNIPVVTGNETTDYHALIRDQYVEVRMNTYYCVEYGWNNEREYIDDLLLE